MQTEGQARRLERLMQRRLVYTDYTLCFPPVFIRKRAFKRLQPGDLLLLGMAYLKTFLWSKEAGYTRVEMLPSNGRCQIVQQGHTMEEETEKVYSKKYKHIKIVLGTLQSGTLATGHQIETASIDYRNVTLYVEERHLADGKLVVVDDEIAVQITEMAVT
jgi:hypothetical protein